MSDDTHNLELLETIHQLADSSAKAQQLLGDLISIPTESGFVPLSDKAAGIIKNILSVQSRLITNLLEENQTIKDRLESLVARLENE